VVRLWAQVEVCLFDKTGTLTTDQLVCTGTISFSNDEQKNATETGPRAVDSVQSTSFEMCVVMGACHALVEVRLCGWVGGWLCMCVCVWARPALALLARARPALAVIGQV
jgi:cation transport ATPase